MINAVDTVNWNTTRLLCRKFFFAGSVPELPFKTFNILNDDRKKAGYKPASTPTSKVKPNPIPNALKFKKKPMATCFPARSLKYGNKRYTNPKASSMEKSVSITDSTRNWVISHSLSDPITLRIPTSFERRAELAVDRLVKLMQASSRINTANAPKMYT